MGIGFIITNLDDFWSFYFMPFGKKAWKIEGASKINFMLYTCENDVRDISSFPDKLSKRFTSN